MIKVPMKKEFEQLQAELDSIIVETIDSSNGELVYIIKDEVDFNHAEDLIQSVYAYGETGDGETSVMVTNKYGEHRFSLGG